MIAREKRLKPSTAANFNLSSSVNKDIKSSMTSIDGETVESPTREDTILAAEIVSDYLSETMTATLLKELSISMSEFASQSQLAKRKNAWDQPSEEEERDMLLKVAAVPGASSKPDLSISKTNSATKSAAKGTTTAANTKKNEVAAKGSASIMSFFGKK